MVISLNILLLKAYLEYNKDTPRSQVKKPLIKISIRGFEFLIQKGNNDNFIIANY